MRTALTTLEKMELAKKINALNDSDFLEVVIKAYNNHFRVTDEPINNIDIALCDPRKISDLLFNILTEIKPRLLYDIEIHTAVFKISEEEYDKLTRGLPDCITTYNKMIKLIEGADEQFLKRADVSDNFDEALSIYNDFIPMLETTRKNYDKDTFEILLDYVTITSFLEDQNGNIERLDITHKIDFPCI